MDADARPNGLDSLLLVQFARSPREGEVKTRMIPQLSPGEACALHCELTLWTCQRLLDSALGAVELAVAGNPFHPLFKRCRELGVARLSGQQGADLGDRMYHAIRTGLESYGRVILVGSDCPGIDTAYLLRAVLALRGAPVVLGPATDGGYVLIGARFIRAEVFSGIPWGTDGVCDRTREALRASGLNWVELPPLPDIDRPEDLPVWEELKRAAATAARTS